MQIQALEAADEHRRLKEARESLRQDRSDLEASLKQLEGQRVKLNEDSVAWAADREAEHERLRLAREELEDQREEMEKDRMQNAEMAGRLADRTHALLEQEDCMAKREVCASLGMFQFDEYENESLMIL